MTNNYVGPGWYWVEGEEDPLLVKKVFGRYELHGIDMHALVDQELKLTHIPRPITRPVVDWSAMPAWAKWVCATYWGSWRWASAKPTLEDRYWAITDGYGGEIPKEHEPKYTGDWKNSLVGRPE